MVNPNRMSDAAKHQEVEEIRDRAASGVVSVGLRNLLVRALGLVGNVVLARLLTPADFGVIAFGLTITVLGAALTTGGLGASLVQRETAPTRHDLGVALGFQVACGLVIVALVAAVALPVGGQAGVVACVMVLALPIDSFRVPAGIVTTRRLDFGLLAKVEVSEVVVFNVASILLVALGMGVWGVAVASLLRAVAGAGLLVARGPVGFVGPRLDLPTLRGHLHFGLANQGATLLNATRDQGLNLLIAAVGGVVALGIWSLAYRLLQSVMLLLQALWRVSFPATARLLAAGEDARHLLSRSIALVAMVTGVMVVALAGPAPATVPVLFGSNWDDVVGILPWGAAALMVSGPISTSGIGFLWAVGDGGRVLRAVAAQTTVWLGATATLLALDEPAAVGIGMFLGNVVLAVTVSAAVRHHVTVPVLRLVIVPALAAAGASVVGWLIADAAGRGVPALCASLAAAVAIYGAAVGALKRPDAAALANMLRRSLRRAAPSPVAG